MKKLIYSELELFNLPTRELAILILEIYLQRKFGDNNGYRSYYNRVAVTFNKKVGETAIKLLPPKSTDNEA